MRPAAETRSGQPTEPVAVLMGYRGRHQRLLRPYFAPPPDESATRTRRRSPGDAAGRAVLEGRRTGRGSVPPHRQWNAPRRYHLTFAIQHCAQRNRGTLREVGRSPHETLLLSHKRWDYGSKKRAERRSKSWSVRVLARALRRRFHPARGRHKGGRPGGEIRSGRLLA